MDQVGAPGMGDFLRSRRERLRPEELGLPTTRRRRTPGLRREEVAELAGIGVDWYVRLEQGRGLRPSRATVDALAAALRLDAAEATHLRVLAGAPDQDCFSRESVPTATRRLVEGLGEPAYVTGRRWDVLAWNAASVELLKDFGRSRQEDRNVLVYLLLDPAARALFGAGWSDQARRAVAQFRAACDLRPHDRAFTDLADRLRQGCPEFRAWWDRHDVLGSGAGCKRLHHPVRGPVTYDFATFQLNEDRRLTLTVYASAT